MTPYEIMLSESQERMLIVAEKGREDEVFAVFKKWGLDAVTIGAVTDDGMLRVKDHGEVVAEIPNRELADEAPLYDRPHDVAPYRPAPMEAPEFGSRDLNGDLLALLASGDVCSKRWIWQQYDYTVRTNTLAGPGGDAAIVRIKETGTSIAMSLDGNGRYCALSPREGAKLHGRRVLPQSFDRGRDAGGGHQQSELRQSGAARNHGANGRGDRRHQRGLPLLRYADHRRQRQPVQRNAGRGDLAVAGDGHRGTDENRAAGDHSVQASRGAP